jgi:type IV pilus assembly protein PilB
MCKTSYTVTRTDLLQNLPPEIIDKHFADKQEIRIYKGAGCKICHSTGYVGRVGVFEILEVTPKVKQLIIEKAEADEIGRVARAEGMNTMLDDGINKVVKGVTTIEEVLRVTKVET